MDFDYIEVKFLFNIVELLTLKRPFYVSGQFCQSIFCRKPGNMLCFDSEVDLHSLKLDNRAFSSRGTDAKHVEYSTNI